MIDELVKLTQVLGIVTEMNDLKKQLDVISCVIEKAQQPGEVLWILRKTIKVMQRFESKLTRILENDMLSKR